jgi:uncharacterized protein involved in high-affinity Fe2+ transport
MALTPAQEAADVQLRAAIEACVKAFDLAPDHDLIVDYVVTGVAVSLDDEQQGETQMFCVMPGGTMPHYRLIGLLRQAQVHFEADV